MLHHLQGWVSVSLYSPNKRGFVRERIYLGCSWNICPSNPKTEVSCLMLRKGPLTNLPALRARHLLTGHMGQHPGKGDAEGSGFLPAAGPPLPQQMGQPSGKGSPSEILLPSFFPNGLCYKKQIKHPLFIPSTKLADQHPVQYPRLPDAGCPAADAGYLQLKAMRKNAPSIGNRIFLKLQAFLFPG